MKPYYVLILTLFFCSFEAFPQAKITLGDPYAVVDAAGKFYFVQNGEILTVKEGRSDIILQKMNAETLKFVNVRSYNDFPENYSLENVKKIKNRYYVFYSLSGDTQKELFAREIDFAAGTFTGPGQKIVTVDEKIDDWGFSINFSYDSSALLVRYRFEPEKKRDAVSYDIIGMHVFDGNLQEKWTKKVTMPYTEKKMNNLDYSVDADGNVYIVARVFSDNTTDIKNERDEANYKIEILKVAAGIGTVTSTKADVADKFIKTMWLYETAQGTMIGAGFYNKGNEAGSADGIVLIKFRADGGLSDMKTYEIPLEILNQYASVKSKRKNAKKEGDGEAELKHMRLQEVFIQADGAIVLVGEQQFEIQREYTTQTGRTSYTTTSYYNDLLVAKIDASGNLAWMKKLPKRQIGSLGTGGLSYQYANGNDSHFLLFLDNAKNKDLPVTEEPTPHMNAQGGILTAYKLNDKTGEVNKLSLVDIRDVQGVALAQFRPSRMFRTGPNTLVFEAYRKNKEDVLVKVVLDK